MTVFREREAKLDELEIPLAPGSYAVRVRPKLDRSDRQRHARRLAAIRSRYDGRAELVGSWRKWRISLSDAGPLAEWTRQLAVDPGARVELQVDLRSGWPVLLELPVAPGEEPPDPLESIRTDVPIAEFGCAFRLIGTVQRRDGPCVGVYLTEASLGAGRYEWQLTRFDDAFVRAVVESGPFAVGELDRR